MFLSASPEQTKFDVKWVKNDNVFYEPDENMKQPGGHRRYGYSPDMYAHMIQQATAFLHSSEGRYGTYLEFLFFPEPSYQIDLPSQTDLLRRPSRINTQ